MDRKKLDVKKVLFVDDEVNILKSIRRELFDSSFEVLVAGSGYEGLKILERERIDVVVSDVKMPSMDGIQFLSFVKEKYPKINRIILSGFVEKSTVVSSIIKGIANSYFAKPWNTGTLKTNIEHILDIESILNQKHLLSIINSIEELPTLPAIYKQLLVAINEDFSVTEIAKILESDISISARILKVANSAFHGNLILSSVERALIHLGINTIKDIVLTVSIIDAEKMPQQMKKHLADIYNHSSCVNSIIRKLYKPIFNEPLDDNYSSTGITFDIGKIILLRYFPDRFHAIVEFQEAHDEMDFYLSEVKLGYENVTHAEIGSYFLSWWNLPLINVEAAMFHHSPDLVAPQYKEIVKLTAFADELVFLTLRHKKMHPNMFKLFEEYISKEDLEILTADIIGEINEHGNYK